jgi:excisionase family DNA binding protein
MSKMEPLLSVRDVASLLNIHHKKVQRRVRTGVLPCIKVGSVYRFRPSMLDAWISSQTQVPSAAPVPKVQPASGLAARWTGERPI